VISGGEGQGPLGLTLWSSQDSPAAGWLSGTQGEGPRVQRRTQWIPSFKLL
jgi:hypothetical protein